MRDGIQAIVTRLLPSGSFVIDPSGSEQLQLLAKRFPVCGSKIDWSNVPGCIDLHVPHLDAGAYGERAVHLVEQLVSVGTLAWGAPAVVVADGPDDEGARLTLGAAVTVLPQLLALPQHTYILDPTAAWCLCFTMEGSISFGVAPR